MGPNLEVGLMSYLVVRPRGFQEPSPVSMETQWAWDSTTGSGLVWVVSMSFNGKGNL